jgi:hypothetical protein
MADFGATGGNDQVLESARLGCGRGVKIAPWYRIEEWDRWQQAL